MRTLLKYLLVSLVLIVNSPMTQAGGLSMAFWPTPPVYTGTDYVFGVTITKESPGDGVNQIGPFTFHAYFPEGMTATGGSGGGWSCATPPSGSRELICTANGTLTGSNPSLSNLSVYARADLAMPLGPTEISATLSSAQVPLPPVRICAPTPSTSGCATAAPTVIESKLEITGWEADPSPVSTWWKVAEAGVPQIITVNMAKTGFGITPSILKVWFPLGVTYSGTTSGFPPGACSAVMELGHQLLTCTGPMYQGDSGFAAIRTDFSHDIAVPGPLYFHAAIGNAQIPPPTTCVADPSQRGCGRLAVNTRPSSVAFLRFDDPDVQHSPPYFTVGQDNGPVIVNFRNIGDGVAANTAIQIKLPPGFAYTHTFSAIPALSCTTSGTLASGQLLTCQGAPMAASASGYLSFGVHLDPVLTDVPGPLPLLGAIDTSNPANTTLLASCANDPSPSNCFWHEIPTDGWCLGTDAIFCDGFEDDPLPTQG